jgi:oligopeptide transport system substrate-binding protein
MNKFGKLSGTAGLAVACALALSACGNNNGGNKKAISWMDPSELVTMDPSKFTDQYSAEELNNSMEGLVRIGKDNKIEPGIATSWHQSKDGKKWTFNLRKNAKWANGAKVTAKDFVYSWRRTVNPKTGSEYAYLFSGIKNADAANQGKASVNSLGVHAQGDYKLVVNLDHRIPYFKLLMGFPLFFPENQAFVEKAGSKFGSSSKYALANGPYVQKGWTGTNLSWRLVKNKRYWDKKKVKLDTINFSVQKSPSTSYNLYQSNKIDATLLDINESRNEQGKKGWTVRRSDSTNYLQYNLAKDKNLANKNFRLALSQAINKKQLAKTVGVANQPATSFTADATTKVDGKGFSSLVENAQTKEAQDFNKAKAKQSLRKAQQELGKKQFTINLLADDTDDAKNASSFLQSQWETNLKGVKVNVQNVPFKNRLSRVSAGNFDVVLTGWTADFSDPISFLNLMEKDNAQNYGKWSNARYDALIDASNKNGNVKSRLKQLAQADSIVVADQGVTPLYFRNQAWLVRPNVKNVIYNGAGAPLNFKEAYIK